MQSVPWKGNQAVTDTFDLGAIFKHCATVVSVHIKNRGPKRNVTHSLHINVVAVLPLLWQPGTQVGLDS